MFSASATADKVLAIQLPPGTYQTVLLAGTKTGTLLASAYIPDQEVKADTPRITYDLKALDVAVNGSTNKAALFNEQDLVPGGVTKDGLPYFNLSLGRVSTGTITIGNFPDPAIFAAALINDSGNTAFQGAITAIAKMGAYDLVRLDGVYESLTRDAVFLANAAEADKEFEDAAGRDRYIANATAAVPVLAELADVTAGFNKNETFMAVSGIYSPVQSASNQSYAQAGVKAAWGKVFTGVQGLKYPYLYGVLGDYANALRSVGQAYTKAAGLSAGKDTYSENDETKSAIETATTLYEGLSPPNISTFAELQAFFGLINTAVTATSGLRLGSAGVGSRPAVIPFAGGYVDFDTGIVHFTLATPQVSGLTKLYFDFAFKPFGSSSANTWHIKEGIDNYVIDDGKGQGGSILLSIGGEGSIIIDRGNTP
jgi:hypothetical protein